MLTRSNTTTFSLNNLTISSLPGNTQILPLVEALYQERLRKELEEYLEYVSHINNFQDSQDTVLDTLGEYIENSQ